jgi:hypothetical protein
MSRPTPIAPLRISLLYAGALLTACAQPPAEERPSAVSAAPGSPADQARLIFTGDLEADLYEVDGHVGCSVRPKGQAIKADMPEPSRNLTPCLHIGPIGIGLSQDAIEGFLGAPMQTRPKGEGIEQRAYLVERGEPWLTYFVIDYRDGLATAVQFTGGPSAQHGYKLVKIGLGDPTSTVLEKLGRPTGRCPVPEIQAIVWTWPLPLSIEVRERRVFSMRVASPRQQPLTEAGDGMTAHFQSGTGGQFSGPQRSLDDLAASIAKTGLVADRAATADIAWPADTAELEALGRNAVLHVISAAQTASELPISKVYVLADSAKPIELTRIGMPRLTKLDPASPVGKLIGPHQEESFFLLPISATACRGEISIDFAQGRSAFTVIGLPAATPPSLLEDEYREPGKPSPDRLRRFMRREWPQSPLPVEAHQRAERMRHDGTAAQISSFR